MDSTVTVVLLALGRKPIQLHARAPARLTTHRSGGPIRRFYSPVFSLYKTD
jgi:hypothetical protein